MYPNEASEATLEIDFIGRIRYDDNIRYFHNSIKRLKIVDKAVWSPCFYTETYDKMVQRSLVKFVKAKCAQNLEKITFDGDNVGLGIWKDLASYLRGVEIVQFMNRTQRGEDESTFLNYCQNIRKLVLFDMACAQKVNAIFCQTFHHLEHFHFHCNPTTLNIDNLKLFFRMNKKIKCVVWKYYNLSYAVTGAVECIRSIAEMAGNLQHFYFLIDQQLTDRFADICSYFKVMCDSPNFQSLELEFDDDADAYDVLTTHGYRLANFTQLTKIRLSCVGAFPALQSLAHLKIIVLRNGADRRMITLPQVEELQIGGSSCSMSLKKLVRHWPNLKTILLPGSGNISRPESYIAELNREREKLPNACELTIYTGCEKNKTNVEHKLVKLKFVEFQYGFDVNIFSKCCNE